jgi:hypothetical protein
VTTYDVPRVNTGDGELMALAASVENLTAAASQTSDLESGLRTALNVLQFNVNERKPICERVRRLVYLISKAQAQAFCLRDYGSLSMY